VFGVFWVGCFVGFVLIFGFGGLFVRVLIVLVFYRFIVIWWLFVVCFILFRDVFFVCFVSIVWIVFVGACVFGFAFFCYWC